MGNSYKPPILIPPCFEGEYFRLPLKEKPFVGYDPDITIQKIDFNYREIRLLPFRLETGAKIKGAYDEETDTVIMTGHSDMKNRMGIGLAANYIEFILSLPPKAWS